MRTIITVGSAREAGKCVSPINGVRVENFSVCNSLRCLEIDFQSIRIGNMYLNQVLKTGISSSLCFSFDALFLEGEY